MDEIFILAEHIKGKITDTTYEILTLGREISANMNRPLKAVLLGKGVGNLAMDLGYTDGVVMMEHDLLANVNIQTWSIALMHIIKEKKPEMVIMGSTNSLMGLGSYIAEKMGLPYMNLCKGLRVEDQQVVGNAILYGGKIEADVRPCAKPILVSVRPGNYPGDPARTRREVPVECVTPPDTLMEAKINFKEFIQAERKDIDITQCDVLVAVGRGIQNKENIVHAETLAKIFKNAAVVGSRPIIDQEWLPLTRLVGRSGMSVRPKLYLALGISGAPEHMEGMKGAQLIVAINKDKKAPIFRIAHYGVAEDLFKVIPKLAERLKK